MADITGLLLAAGASTRFGANKLTAPLDGRAMLLHAARALSPCDRIVVVVREGEDELQSLLQSAGLQTVTNEQAWRGMGSSIACGVSASQGSDGWCILPADMPRVSRDTTQRIVHALRNGAALVAPYYQHRRGHPVGFNKEFATSLAALKGEVGARSLVERHQDTLLRIETNDAGVVVDVDTAPELARLEQAWISIPPA
jgi:molybdenum cofactor cytidylyltransferase